MYVFKRLLEDMIPKAQATKAKTDKVDYIKIENFCASKYTLNREKRQLMQWDNKKQSDSKMGKGLESISLQRRYTNGQ